MVLLDVDPNLVGPGGVALLIVVVLAAVVVLLIFSMRRQMRKIRVPRRDENDTWTAETPSDDSDAQPTAPADDEQDTAPNR